MDTVMTTSRRTQWMAGATAALATLLTAGGPLMLAEHYARTGASWDASGYHATERTRRIACSDLDDSRTPAASARRRTEDS